MTLNLDPTEILESYELHRPTGFDRHIGLADQDKWLMAPVSLSRDSNVRETSNWEVVTEDIQTHDQDGDCEIHRFGHWGCGWYEVMIVRPGSKCAVVAAQWACALADDPIACDERYSEALIEEADRTWDSMGLREKIKVCDRFGFSIFAARGEIPDDRVMDYLIGH